MSLLDKASLIITPNAYKESKLYSVIPNTTLGDMDVVRATTATRVNSSGLIEVVPRNLLTYSEQFENGNWTKLNTTITPNSINSPTGTLTADSLVGNTTNARHNILQSLSGTSDGSYSLYVKANQLRYIQFASTNGIGQFANFDVLTGTIGTVGGDFSNAQITLITNGWYRISVTSVARYNNFYISLVSSLTAGWLESWAMPNNTDSLYIWGAQLDQGSLTEYFPTTTRLNIPRIDYTNGSCPSLLVEPQRTNLLTYSNTFSNAYWSKSLNVSSNSIISPNGTTDSTTCTRPTTSTIDSNLRAVTSQIPSTVYTLTVYAKAGNSTKLYLRNLAVDNGTVIGLVKFDLVNGTIDLTNGSKYINNSSITSVGNGWYRCSITGTTTSTISTNLVDIGTTSSGIIGGTAGDFVYIWGAQLETGSYATSYIPTVASTVTRNADVISKTGISSLIGQTEGVFYAEINGFLGENTARLLSIFNTSLGTYRNYINISLRNITNLLRFTVAANGITIRDFSTTVVQTNFNKIAIKYSQSGYSFWLNGVKVADGVTACNFQLLDSFRTSDVDGSSPFNGNIKTVQLYKTALTDTEMANLTTL